MMSVEITDEMVEAAALSLRNDMAQQFGVTPCSSVDETVNPDYWRRMARTALEAVAPMIREAAAEKRENIAALLNEIERLRLANRLSARFFAEVMPSLNVGNSALSADQIAIWNKAELAISKVNP